MNTETPKPSDKRNGCFLDSMWCCKVCDGEIPDGHTDDCYIWGLEKKHRDFIANEYSTALTERDNLKMTLSEREGQLRECVEYMQHLWNDDYHCPRFPNEEGVCQCGLDDLRARLKETL